MVRLDDREALNLNRRIISEFERTIALLKVMGLFNIGNIGGLCIENRKYMLLFFYTVCYVSYIALGGLCFLVLEGPQENAQYNKVAVAKVNFINKHPDISEDALNDFLNEMSSFRIRSWNTPNSTAKWTYGEAVFFSVTLLTTIGYGHITPVSPMGKIVCIMYAGMGIPMTLLLLASYVHHLMRAAAAFRRALCWCLDQSMSPFYVRLLHLITILILILLLFFMLPATLFSYLEDGWTFLDALYFCFISLTTVGLGDFVPGLTADQPYAGLYRFGVTLYVLTGVTAMMFMMAITAEFQHSLSQCESDTLSRMYPPEKIPITIGNTNNLDSYGSILKQKTKVKEDKKRKETTPPV